MGLQAVAVGVSLTLLPVFSLFFSYQVALASLGLRGCLFFLHHVLLFSEIKWSRNGSGGERRSGGSSEEWQEEKLNSPSHLL